MEKSSPQKILSAYERSKLRHGIGMQRIQKQESPSRKSEHSKNDERGSVESSPYKEIG